MSSDPITRVNYFSGEALLTDDFQTEQSYHRTMLQQMHQNLHTPGVVCGLTVTVTGDSVEVSPGMALDSQGLQLVLTNTATISGLPTHDGNYFLTISYDETLASFTDETHVGGYKRIQETPLVRLIKETAYSGSVGGLVVIAILDCSGDTPTVLSRDAQGERTYANVRVGGVAFSVNGGYADGKQTVPMGISASHTDSGDCLTVDAPRTIFTGDVDLSGTVNFDGDISYRKDFGIHVDPPQASLHVRSKETTGEGTLSTNDGIQFTISKSSKVVANDVLLIKLPMPNAWQVRNVKRVGGDGRSLTIDPPLFPVWDASAQYDFSYAPNENLLKIDFGDQATALQISQDGTVEVGLPVGAGSAPVVIQPDGTVGLGLPTVGQDKDHAVSLSPSGDVEIFGDVVVRGGMVGGRSCQGSGTVTYSRGQLLGSGTKFRTDVHVGDTIAAGTLVYATANIGSIDLGDGTVNLVKNLPFAFSKASYSYAKLPASDGVVSTLPSDVLSGLGTISGADTTITFSEPGVVRLLAKGYALYIPLYVPNIGWLNAGDRLRVSDASKADGNAQSWVVQSIQDDRTLTLMPPSVGSVPFGTSSFSYVVTQSTLMQIRANDDASILNCADKGVLSALPPALVATANGATAVAPNTVAINVEVGQTDSAYALQVGGGIKAGAITAGSMAIETMTIKEIEGQSLSIGQDGVAPVLTADATNGVSIGGTAGDPLLKVADNEVYLKSTVLSFTGSATIDLGQLAYGFAERAAPITITADSTSTSQAFDAKVDGFIVASLTPPDPCPTGYYAILTATATDANGHGQPPVCISSFAFVAGPGGNLVALPASITLPTASGDSWSLTLDSVAGKTVATVVSLPTAKPSGGSH